MTKILQEENLVSLLSGQEIKHGNNWTSYLGSTTLITDNDPTTGFVLRKQVQSSSISDFIIYNFDSPQAIDKFKIFIEDYKGQSVHFCLEDSKGEVLYLQDNLLVPGDDQIYSLPKRITNVKKAYIWNFDEKGSDYKVIEWDLYRDTSLDLFLSAIGDKGRINLQWNKIDSATSYTVKRALKSGGPFEVIATNITDTAYIDHNIEFERTYYYIVSALNESTELVISNEASAKVNKPERAILKITLVNEIIKEYDLSTKELKVFIDWYDTRTKGIGLEEYAFKKSWNMGPFATRTEYVTYSKIVMFEVDEYFHGME